MHFFARDTENGRCLNLSLRFPVGSIRVGSETGPGTYVWIIHWTGNCLCLDLIRRLQHTVSRDRFIQPNGQL